MFKDSGRLKNERKKDKTDSANMAEISTEAKEERTVNRMWGKDRSNEIQLEQNRVGL